VILTVVPRDEGDSQLHFLRALGFQKAELKGIDPQQVALRLETRKLNKAERRVLGGSPPIPVDQVTSWSEVLSEGRRSVEAAKRPSQPKRAVPVSNEVKQDAASSTGLAPSPAKAEDTPALAERFGVSTSQAEGEQEEDAAADEYEDYDDEEQAALAEDFEEDEPNNSRSASSAAPPQMEEKPESSRAVSSAAPPPMVLFDAEEEDDVDEEHRGNQDAVCDDGSFALSAASRAPHAPNSAHIKSNGGVVLATRALPVRNVQARWRPSAPGLPREALAAAASTAASAGVVPLEEIGTAEADSDEQEANQADEEEMELDEDELKRFEELKKAEEEELRRLEEEARALDEADKELDKLIDGMDGGSSGASMRRRGPGTTKGVGTSKDVAADPKPVTRVLSSAPTGAWRPGLRAPI